MIQATSETARVPVRSAWFSKINWTQAVAVLASVGVVFGISMPPETQVSIVAGIQGAQALVTWALRTFFNNSVSPASLEQ